MNSPTIESVVFAYCEEYRMHYELLDELKALRCLVWAARKYRTAIVAKYGKTVTLECAEELDELMKAFPGLPRKGTTQVN